MFVSRLFDRRQTLGLFLIDFFRRQNRFFSFVFTSEIGLPLKSTHDDGYNITARFLTAGGKDDDRRGDHFRHLLATVSYLLHRNVAHARADHRAVHTRRVLGVLLAGHVQFHAQPDRVLLDELQVSRRRQRGAGDFRYRM